MNKILFFLPLMLFFSCSIPEVEPSNNHETQDDQTQEVSNDLKGVKIDYPVLLENSPLVLYPLILRDGQGGSYDLSLKKRYYNKCWWDILFYQPANGQWQPLLGDSLKMAIYKFGSFQHQSEVSESGAKTTQTKYPLLEQFIYYQAINIDYNRDGGMAEGDPVYLFVSDPQGKNLRRISPDKHNIISWFFLASSDELLMMASKDTNGDNIFDHTDEIFPFKFNLKTAEGPTEILDRNMLKTLKKRLDQKWGKE